MPRFEKFEHWIKQQLSKTGNFPSISLIVLCSVIAALSAILFMVAVNRMFKLFYEQMAVKGLLRFSLISFSVICLSSLLVGWLLSRFCKDAAGSGVPQLKASFWQQFGVVTWRSVWVKFIAGILSIGGGASLGREGPSAFFGGGVSSLITGAMGFPRRYRRGAAVTGTAAALAAAFNAPLAAIAFVLEEIIHDFGSRLIGRVMLASVIGALVVHAIIGPQPAFALPSITEPDLIIYTAVFAVAICAALVAALFQHTTLSLRKRMLASAMPKWLHPLMGGLITWVLGISVFAATGRLGVFGLGYDDLSLALTTDDITARTALILLVAKLAATIACYGFGGCGGIFSPTLFLGAMTGLSLGGLFQLWMPLTGNDLVLLASVGMCACFGATVRAPWSAMLIVFEMTHNFAVMPGLLFGSMISQVIVRLFGQSNFYDAILYQDGHPVHEVAPPRTLNDWQEAEVITVANPRPVILKDMSANGITSALNTYPYKLFPVQNSDGSFAMTTRKELESSLRDATSPRLGQIALAREHQTISEVSGLFLQSEHGMILVVKEPDNTPIGLLTLHDLLRAQTSLRE